MTTVTFSSFRPPPDLTNITPLAAKAIGVDAAQEHTKEKSAPVVKAVRISAIFATSLIQTDIVDRTALRETSRTVVTKGSTRQL
jgi:hypothetical protein